MSSGIVRKFWGDAQIIFSGIVRLVNGSVPRPPIDMVHIPSRIVQSHRLRFKDAAPLIADMTETRRTFLLAASQLHGRRLEHSQTHPLLWCKNPSANPAVVMGDKFAPDTKGQTKRLPPIR
jgi:hypothetical protein